MAFLKGKDGVVKLGSPALAVAFVQSWNLDEEADEVSGWGMGDEYETSFTTVKRFSGSAEVYFDPGNASANLRVGDEIKLELYPGGETSGSAYFTGEVCISALAHSGDKGGIPNLKINFKGRGDLTRQAVA